jgi:hypothetical protein
VHPVAEYLYEEGKIVWHYENSCETRMYRRRGRGCRCVEALFSRGIAAADKGYTQIAPGYSIYGGQHDHPITAIRDMESLMKRMFRENPGFCEAKVPWAVPGEEVAVSAPAS